MSKTRGIALFDLDFTLIPHDTLLVFCNYVLKKERLRMLFLLVFAPAVPFAALRLLRGAGLKRIFLCFLWRMPSERLDAYARDFVRTCVTPEFYPEMRAKLEEHKRAGDLVVLNTASPEFYVRYIAEELGVDHCYATRLEFSERMPFRPAYIGSNNKRMAKMHAMRDILPGETAEFLAAHPAATADDPGYTAMTIPGSRAYSDSSADLPMLVISESAAVVHPASKLRERAERENWTILTPWRGYNSTRTRFLHAVLQLFGLYRTRNLKTS